MAPELVYLIAPVWVSMATLVDTFIFLSCCQRQVISMDSMLVFLNYIFLSIAKQTARGPVTHLTVLLLVSGFFLVEKFPIYHFPTTNFNPA